MTRFPKVPAANQEAAVVDSLIRKLRPLDTSTYPSQRSSSSARPLSRMRPIRGPMSALAVWTCVCLGVLLGAALPYWPYERACGTWLSLYLVAVGTVLIAGLWGARVSWRSRLGFAHTIAVCTIIWGVALTAQEILPRVGYAKTRLAWRCHDGHAATVSPTRLATLLGGGAGTADLVR